MSIVYSLKDIPGGYGYMSQPMTVREFIRWCEGRAKDVDITFHCEDDGWPDRPECKGYMTGSPPRNPITVRYDSRKKGGEYFDPDIMGYMMSYAYETRIEKTDHAWFNAWFMTKDPMRR